jgi:general stress protein 26
VVADLQIRVHGLSPCHGLPQGAALSQSFTTWTASVVPRSAASRRQRSAITFLWFVVQLPPSFLKTMPSSAFAFSSRFGGFARNGRSASRNLHALCLPYLTEVREFHREFFEAGLAVAWHVVCVIRLSAKPREWIMQAEESPREEVREVAKLIADVPVAMLTTRRGDGRLVSRPIQTRQMEFDGELWFLTSIDSNKVQELSANPQVNLAYVNSGDKAYVSIDGCADVVRDRRKVDELWSQTFDTLYFSGKDDPSLVLLRVVAETAECWTGSSTALGRAYDFLKAKVSGDASAMGTQKHVRIA